MKRSVVQLCHRRTAVKIIAQSDTEKWVKYNFQDLITDDETELIDAACALPTRFESPVSRRHRHYQPPMTELSLEHTNEGPLRSDETAKSNIFRSL
ncbi:hypothetical protein EVAR_96770_1 [Eumeta japonica]|uniref:Uncharacterized protein n=1 Tax=Eumeta variegata TaxID=151549 RepID=A0A4C1WSB1_EUMVA|nr:hypothetical protein EVAR_96770_1 [Eumeta japonica]